MQIAVIIGIAVALCCIDTCRGQICGPHEMEVDCVPVCQPTCQDPVWRPLFPDKCAKGCMCDVFNGYVRGGPNGTCIPSLACNNVTEWESEFEMAEDLAYHVGDQIDCPTNEIGVDCLPICQPTCQNQTQKLQNPDVCAKGCMCDVKNGYVRSLDGRCISKNTCNGACDPSICKNGGTCQNDPDGFHCDCPSGYDGDYCENKLSCGDTIQVHRSTAGDFQSPGYPFHTEPNQKCTWTLVDADNVGKFGPVFAQVSGFKDNACGISGNGLIFYGSDTTQPLTTLCYFDAPGPVPGLDEATKMTIVWQNEEQPNAKFFLSYSGKDDGAI